VAYAGHQAFAFMDFKASFADKAAFFCIAD